MSATHEVTNQVPPLVGHDPIAGDRALAEACVRHADDAALASLADLGRLAGSERAQEWGRLDRAWASLRPFEAPSWQNVWPLVAGHLGERAGWLLALTAAVTAELIRRRIRTIALNVHVDNAAALRVYERLCYERYCTFIEGYAIR